MNPSWSAHALKAADDIRIKSFRCATTQHRWDTEVETWVRASSVGWATDESHADMDRRLLLLRNERGAIAGIVAHELKDAVAPGIDGGLIVRLLTAIAVARAWQGKSIGGQGRVSDVLLATALSDISARPQDVPFVNAFIHEDNHRSGALFTRNGFAAYPPAVGGYVRYTLSSQ